MKRKSSTSRASGALGWAFPLSYKKDALMKGVWILTNDGTRDFPYVANHYEVKGDALLPHGKYMTAKTLERLRERLSKHARKVAIVSSKAAVVEVWAGFPRAAT
jgi:hypothetical protein